MELGNIEAKNLNHHGLTAAIMKKMNLEKIIDSVLSKTSNNAGISRGKVICALILNGLGFVERRLSMVSTFFEHLPIEKLLGEGIKAEDLNDDQIGRTLDSCFDFGLTELFFYIMMEIGIEFDLFNGFAHLDSTTFSVFGQYDLNEHEVKIAYGHSKDNRSDLKQLTLNLGVSGKGGIPFWMEPLSGNSSDVKSFHKSIDIFHKFREELGKGPLPVWVADSALYTAKRLLKKEFSFYWITRVPERIKEAKNLVELDSNKIEWKELEKGYSISTFDSNYKDVKQRWVLVYSEQAKKREMITLEKNIEKEEDLVWKEIKKLEKKIFINSADAEEHYQKLKKYFKFYTFCHKEIKSLYKEVRGKTATGKKKKKLIGYQLKLIMSQNKTAIAKKKNSKGRFILATNYVDDLYMLGEDILREYKNQLKVEKGFRFLKDPSFLVSDVYVKKPERFQALLFIMALTLAVYSFGEYWVRKALKEKNKTYPNQYNKEKPNPTLKWIFRSMRGIIYLCINLNGKLHEEVKNTKEHHRKILNIFGEDALILYGFI